MSLIVIDLSERERRVYTIRHQNQSKFSFLLFIQRHEKRRKLDLFDGYARFGGVGARQPHQLFNHLSWPQMKVDES